MDTLLASLDVDTPSRATDAVAYVQEQFASLGQDHCEFVPVYAQAVRYAYFYNYDFAKQYLEIIFK